MMRFFVLLFFLVQRTRAGLARQSLCEFECESSNDVAACSEDCISCESGCEDDSCIEFCHCQKQCESRFVNEQKKCLEMIDENLAQICFENAQEIFDNCVLENCKEKELYDVDFGELGIIRGYLHPTYPDVVAMQGIPFMKPPVGDLRWRAPIIERNLGGYPNSRKINGRTVYYATDISPECPGAFEASSITEDCTYLDIFVPKQAIENGEILKIFLYFHGGAFMGGSNQDVSANEGAIIASEQNLIVITSNYRLGVFGFLFSEHLDDKIAEEHGLEYYENKITSGNQGLMDQQMAMIWTAENARYFAGNAERITIGGMSAGGQSMHAHLVMPSSRELFHKAIAFSGPNGIPFYNNSEGELILQGIANLVSCCEALPGVDPVCDGPTTPEIISCMTGKSSEEINAAAWELRQILPFGNFARLSMIAEPYAPIINTGMLKEMPFYHFKKGEMHDKPTIIDVTDNEGYMFVKPAFSGSKCPNDTYPDSQHVCQENFDLFFEKILSEEDFQALKEFGYYSCPEDGSECLHKADEFLTDFTWYCNLRRCLEDGYPQSDIIRSHRNTPLFLARVTQRLPWMPLEDGVMHGASEHWFFNDTFRSDSKYKDDIKFQHSYVQYISNFIRTGDPNNYYQNPQEQFHHDQAEWHSWVIAAPSKPHQFLDIGAEGTRGFQMQEIDPRKERCDFWDSLDLYMTI